jgi:hypothetical protein
MSAFRPPGDCPVCGEDVHAGATACPFCGSCPDSGWGRDAAIYDGLDLPDEPEEKVLPFRDPSRAYFFNNKQRPAIALFLFLLLLMGVLSWVIAVFR